MRVVRITEAKAPLSRLVSEAADGEPFVFTRAGVRRVTVTATAMPPRRIGLLPHAEMPADFDTRDVA